SKGVDHGKRMGIAYAKRQTGFRYDLQTLQAVQREAGELLLRRPGPQFFEQIGFIAAGNAEAFRRWETQNGRARGFQEGSPKEREWSLTDAAQYPGGYKRYESRR